MTDDTHHTSTLAAGVVMILAALCTTTAMAQDADGDGVPDASDGCPTVPDALQEDTSPSGPDGAGDACAHPFATVALSATHGGQFIGARASLGERSSTGPRTVIGRRALVGDDVTIGADVFLGRSVAVQDGVVIGGGSDVGYASVVGAGAQLGGGVVVGTLVTVGPGTLVEANAVIARGASVLGTRVGTGAVIGPGSTVGVGSTVESGVRIRKDVDIGANVTVASGARIGRDVEVGEGARIGASARVRAGAIIDPGAIVPDGAYVQRGERVSVASIAYSIHSLEVAPGVSLDLVGIDPGVSPEMPASFVMGCLPERDLPPSSGLTCDTGTYREGSGARTVTLTNGFWVGQTEVTQEQFSALAPVGSDPLPEPGNERNPVREIGWGQAAWYTTQMSALEGLPSCYACQPTNSTLGWNPSCTSPADIYACEGYRLCTEAEWEYAARGGEDFWYSGTNDMDETGRSYPSVVDVGQVPVGGNGYGLYEMSGSVASLSSDQTEPILADTNPHAFSTPSVDMCRA